MEIIKELPDEVILWCKAAGIEYVEREPCGYVVLDESDVTPSIYDSTRMLSLDGKVYATIRYSRAIDRFVYNVLNHGEKFTVYFVDDSVIEPAIAAEFRAISDYILVEDANGVWYSLGYDNYRITYGSGVAYVVRSVFSPTLSPEAILEKIVENTGGIKQKILVSEKWSEVISNGNC